MRPVEWLVATCLVSLCAAAIILWPKRGVIGWLRERDERTRRAVIEDALKHMHSREYGGSLATLESLAGVLGVRARQVVEMVERLEALKLITTSAEGLRLTEAGEAMALDVIRAHRLWEVYLADQTGLPPSEWHKEADRREHTRSPGGLEDLTRRTGDPRFDPHGDAIPTEAGELIPRRGIPLGELPVGVGAEVVHVEDEPAPIHDRMVKEGIRFQSRVRLLEAGADALRVLVDGEERTLPQFVAANVWVLPMQADAQEGPTSRLSSLRVGESARVVQIAPTCRGLQLRRLLDLGLVPGTRVSAEMTGPSGDPTAYRIRGALIALRSEQADQIQVADIQAAQGVAAS